MAMDPYSAQYAANLARTGGVQAQLQIGRDRQDAAQFAQQMAMQQQQAAMEQARAEQTMQLQAQQEQRLTEAAQLEQAYRMQQAGAQQSQWDRQFGLQQQQGTREQQQFDFEQQQLAAQQQAAAGMFGAGGGMTSDPMADYNARSQARHEMAKSNPASAMYLAEQDAADRDSTIKRMNDASSGSGAGSSGPYGGTSVAAQNRNILLTGDPSSREYAAAWNDESQPKNYFDTQTGTVTSVTPNMSAYRPPSGMVIAPAQAGSGSTTPSGQTVSVAQGARTPDALKKAEIGTKTLLSALETFKKSYAEAGTKEKVKSAIGAPTPLSSSYANAALLAKGDELYQLGVLNGQDLKIIQNALADPRTVLGAAAGSETVNAQTKMITDLINIRMDEYRKQYGQPSSGGAAPASAGGWAIVQ